MRFPSLPGLTGTLMLLIMAPGLAVAQTSVSSFDSREAFKKFDRLYQVDSRLISGNFYQDPSPKSTTGNPYYGDFDWKRGSVTIDSMMFDTLLLRYDICNNELIINTLNFSGSPFQISLNKDRINTFTLDGRKFIHFPSPDPKKNSRFCEVLAEGTVTLLLLETKSLKVPVNGNTSYFYEPFSRMYLLASNELIAYQGKSALYRQFPQFKAALQGYVRSQKLRFNKNKQSHAQLVNYCNTMLIQEK